MWSGPDMVIAIVPSPPVLVPELAGSAAGELRDLRAGVRTAVRALPCRWIAVGVGAVQRRIAPASAGTFAGYGADIAVALSPGEHPVIELPLCALMAAWLRTEDQPGASVETRCYSASLDVETALRTGRELGAELQRADGEVGVLIIADGCHTLSPSAPGGYHPESLAVQAALDDALAGGDAAALTQLPDSVVGRVGFAVLAGLAGDGPPPVVRELYRGAPYGVGYFAGVWQLTGRP